jgi:hypothetical protein
MKKITNLLFICIALVSFAGCKKYLNVNQDNNDLTSASEALLLSPLEEGMSNYVCGAYNAVLVNYWMQNMTLNQAVPNDVTYLVTHGSFDQPWYNLYVTCLNNLDILNKLALKDGNSTYAGISKVLTVYTLGSATDLWGDIPFSEAFQGTNKTTPAYDSQEKIYTTMQTLLDSAITELGSATGTQPGTDDFIYGGSTAKWIKFAYSLKARYYMHLTKASGYTAATQAQLALTALGSAMTSYADDAYFPYTGTQTASAPIYWDFYNTSTAIFASTYIDSLKARSDPRLPVLAATAPNTGLYTGSVIGSGFGNLNDYSVAGTLYGSANSNGYIFNADEALFLKAEATYYVSGYAAAGVIYRSAITDNMLKLGLDTTSAAAQAYLSARGALTASNAIQRIMEEKSVANFLSMENWVDWRRTGFPALTVISSANGAASGITEVPRRFLYPLNELTNNPQSVQSAAITDRVWWDTK